MLRAYTIYHTTGRADSKSDPPPVRVCVALQHDYRETVANDGVAHV